MLLKPRAFGGKDSHFAFRYSFLDSHSCFVHPRLRSSFNLQHNAPLPLNSWQKAKSRTEDRRKSAVGFEPHIHLWLTFQARLHLKPSDLPFSLRHLLLPPASCILPTTESIPSVPGLSPVEFYARSHSISPLLRVV